MTNSPSQTRGPRHGLIRAPNSVSETIPTTDKQAFASVGRRFLVPKIYRTRFFSKGGLAFLAVVMVAWGISFVSGTDMKAEKKHHRFGSDDDSSNFEDEEEDHKDHHEGGNSRKMVSILGRVVGTIILGLHLMAARRMWLSVRPATKSCGARNKHSICGETPPVVCRPNGPVESPVDHVVIRMKKDKSVGKRGVVTVAPTVVPTAWSAALTPEKLKKLTAAADKHLKEMKLSIPSVIVAGAVQGFHSIWQLMFNINFIFPVSHTIDAVNTATHLTGVLAIPNLEVVPAAISHRWPAFVRQFSEQCWFEIRFVASAPAAPAPTPQLATPSKQQESGFSTSSDAPVTAPPVYVSYSAAPVSTSSAVVPDVAATKC